MTTASGKLNKRALVSIVIALSGLGLPFTGFATHAYAHEPMTVPHHAWMAAHNFLGFLFVVFSVWHVVLNRRPLWAYFKSKAAQIPSLSREAIVAAVIVSMPLLLVIAHAFHGRGR